MKLQDNTLLAMSFGEAHEFKVTLWDCHADGQEAFIYQLRLGSLHKSIWITPYGAFVLS